MSRQFNYYYLTCTSCDVVIYFTFIICHHLCRYFNIILLFFFFQAEDGIRDGHVTGVQTCALPISVSPGRGPLVLVLCTTAADARPPWWEPRRDDVRHLCHVRRRVRHADAGRVPDLRRRAGVDGPRRRAGVDRPSHPSRRGAGTHLDRARGRPRSDQYRAEARDRPDRPAGDPPSSGPHSGTSPGSAATTTRRPAS